jgi:hypothetical protein
MLKLGPLVQLGLGCIVHIRLASLTPAINGFISLGSTSLTC